jgi:hypothetical protein
MSKPSTSRLTPSRKNRRCPVKFNWLAALDAVDERCLGLRAVARLLEASGHRQGAGPLDAVLVSEAGTLMLRELAALQVLLKKAWKEMAR